MKIVKLACVLLLVQFNLFSQATENNKESDSIKSEAANFSIEIISSDLKVPWSFTFLPDGTALVGERDIGQLSLLDIKTGKRDLILGLPEMLRSKKLSAGLFDVVPHPKFAENGQLYIVHAVGTAEASGLAISTAKLVGKQLQGSKILIETTPKVAGKWHFGGRLVIANNYLYLSTGDGYEYSALAQDLEAHAGKILRLNLDGSIPADNPFVTTPDALPEIWSYGVRNPQAMTRHPETNAVWQIDHGPQGGDEINLAEAGKNYGWPVITYGEEYGGGPIGDGITHHTGMEQPLYYWVPSIAPSGATFYSGDVFPRWQGNLFVGALSGKHLNRLVIENGRIIHEERLLKDKDWRVRFVVQGPDGFLYIGVDAGHVVRIKPSPSSAE